MKTLHLVLGMVVILLAVMGAYKFGSRGLAKVTAERDAFIARSNQLDTLLKNSQKELDGKLGDHDRQAAEKLKELERDAASQRAALEHSLADANARIGAKTIEIGKVEVERRKIAEALKTATGATAAALLEKDKNLGVLEKQLQDVKAGLACLGAPVPADEVNVLNRTVAARISL